MEGGKGPTLKMGSFLDGIKTAANFGIFPVAKYVPGAFSVARSV